MSLNVETRSGSVYDDRLATFIKSVEGENYLVYVDYTRFDKKLKCLRPGNPTIGWGFELKAQC